MMLPSAQGCRKQASYRVVILLAGWLTGFGQSTGSKHHVKLHAAWQAVRALAADCVRSVRGSGRTCGRWFTINSHCNASAARDGQHAPLFAA